MNGTTGTTEQGGSSPSHLVLRSVDLVLVAGLIVVGQFTHQLNPLAEPLTSLEAIVPFVFGWLAVTSIAGLYRSGNDGVRSVARSVAVSWLAAVNVGFLLRGSPLFEGDVPWEFTIVLSGLGLVVLLTWRVGFAVFHNR